MPLQGKFRVAALPAPSLLLVLVLTSSMTVQVCVSAVPSLFHEKTFTAASFAEAVNYYVAHGEGFTIQELRFLASDTLTDFKRGFSYNERIGWVCRVLFEPKGVESLRPPGFGALALPYHTMPLRSWPLYPVALSGSTYFILSEGYLLGGHAENPKAYIEYCRTNGIFR